LFNASIDNLLISGPGQPQARMPEPVYDHTEDRSELRRSRTVFRNEAADCVELTALLSIKVLTIFVVVLIEGFCHTSEFLLRHLDVDTKK
jgi:hypothetical protein